MSDQNLSELHQKASDFLLRAEQGFHAFEPLAVETEELLKLFNEALLEHEETARLCMQAISLAHNELMGLLSMDVRNPKRRETFEQSLNDLFATLSDMRLYARDNRSGQISKLVPEIITLQERTRRRELVLDEMWDDFQEGEMRRTLL